MTLEFLLNELCNLGIRHNLVNYAAAGGSIYSLNSETIDGYPFFFFSPTEDIRIEKNFTTCGLVVFYADRLLSDNMNDTQVYSNGTLAIQNLMRQVKAMDGIVGVDDYSIRVFSETEKMADKVNGAYARVNITTLNSYNCSIYFDEVGAPMGTYIPDVIKDTSVLDALASKEWVKRYVSGVAEGITEEEAKELIRKALLAYTKTDKFATINGSGITNNEVYNLLETSEFREFLSGYTQEILEIRSEISAATPSDYDEVKRQVSANTEDIAEIRDSLSALTPSDYDDVKRQVSANTENISTLSAFTSGLSFTVNEHTEKIERLETAVSGINETISTQSSAITGINEAIGSLSAQTSGNTAQILALSGSTEQAVSSLTQDIVALSGATSDALSGITGDIADLETQISELMGSENVLVVDLRNYGTGTTVLQGIYQEMLAAYQSGKTIFLVNTIAETSNYETVPSVTPAVVYGTDSTPWFHFETLCKGGSGLGLRFGNSINFREDGSNSGLVNFEGHYACDGYGHSLNYKATENQPGQVKVGSGLTIVANDATLSVKLGSGLQYDANGAVENPYQGNVSSSSVTSIWSGSLADYQALGTYSNSTLYLII